jgi:VanZ family protein
MLPRWLNWLPAVAWMGLIFAISAQTNLPHAPEPVLDFLLKKGGHLLAYAVLARLYLLALRRGGPVTGRLRLFSLGLAVVYGISDEIHQLYVPGRDGSPVDVVIDSIGAALSMWLVRRG